MFSFRKTNKLQAVADGRLMDITEVPDAVFSAKMLGDGFAITEHDGKVYSPAKGKIRDVFLSKHSLTIDTAKGKSVLIHMGLDTVALKGQGFTVHVQPGDPVKAGDLVAEMDLKLIEKNGKDTIIVVALPEDKGALCVQPGHVNHETEVFDMEG